MDADQIHAPEGSSPLGRSRAKVLGMLRAEDGPLGIREVARQTGCTRTQRDSISRRW